MPLVRGSVTPATWASHGKAWMEWLTFYPEGAWYVAVLARQATKEFLFNLRQKGLSVSVVRKRLAGVALCSNSEVWKMSQNLSYSYKH